MINPHAHRSCGACSLCCKLMDVPEVNAPQGQWCKHCAPGHGCKIYLMRPTVCQTYNCWWVLKKADLSDVWYPLKSKIIVDSCETQDGLIMRFTVDPSYPNRWKEEPYYAGIKKTAYLGLNSPNGTYWKTVVSIDGEWILVLPNKEVPFGPGTLLRYSDSRYDFVQEKSS